MSFFKTSSLALTAAGVIALSSLATAQSNSYEDNLRPQSAEARLSFTVPFGAQRSSPKSEARLEFNVRNYHAPRRSSAPAWVLRSPGLEYTEARVGLTLSKTPSFLVNGRAYEINEDQAHASTAGKVGIGAAVVVAAVVVVGIIVVSKSECFLGEAGGDGCGT